MMTRTDVNGTRTPASRWWTVAAHAPLVGALLLALVNVLY